MNFQKECTFSSPLKSFPGPSTFRDFRHTKSTKNTKSEAALTFLVDQTRFRQNWLSEFLCRKGLKSLDFIGSALLNENPVRLATRIKQKLEIDENTFKQILSPENHLRLWITLVEKKGIFVFRTGELKTKKISLAVSKGFTLSDPRAPHIFLNSQDSEVNTCFTLLHGLVHLWLNEPGNFNLENFETLQTVEDMIESYCKKVVGEILTSKDFYFLHWVDFRETLPERKLKTSIFLNISQEITTKMLLESGMITQESHSKLCGNATRGKTHNLSKMDRNGWAFTRIVITAFTKGDISCQIAAKLLDLDLNLFPPQ